MVPAQVSAAASDVGPVELSLVHVLEPFDHALMLARALAEYSGTRNAAVDGRPLSSGLIADLFIRGLQDGSLDLYLILADGDVAGCLVTSVSDGWLQGHLFYLALGHRGQGIAHVVRQSLLPDLVTRLGLQGFRTLSTPEGIGL